MLTSACTPSLSQEPTHFDPRERIFQNDSINVGILLRGNVVNSPVNPQLTLLSQSSFFSSSKQIIVRHGRHTVLMILENFSSTGLGPLVKTLKKTLAQCMCSTSDLSNSLTHHPDLRVPRAHAGQCHGSRACPQHALASLFWSPVLYPGCWGSWGCLYNSVVISLPKPTWTPHQSPNSLLSATYMLFIWHTHKHIGVGS